MTTTFSNCMPMTPAPSAARITDALRGAVIGYDTTLIALAAELHDQLTPAQSARPTAIFLLAGPEIAHEKDAIAHALADVLGYDWGLYNFADPNLTAAWLFQSGPSGPLPGSLQHQLMNTSL